jgi:hypothetical protein
MDRLELREEPMTRWGGVALGGDLLLFLIFAAMGRASHGLLLEGPRSGEWSERPSPSPSPG